MSRTAPTTGGLALLPAGWVVLLTAFALVAAACSGSATGAEASPQSVPNDQECALGLDLWDSDPALTWIQDGRVWVRTGDHQACLSTTEANRLWWSPDGRRLLLDDDVVEGETALSSPVAADVRSVVWQQPFGDALHIVDDSGEIASDGLGLTDPDPLGLPDDIVLLASHPDGEHFAAIDESGEVILVNSGSGASANALTMPADQVPLQLEFSPDGSRLWLLAGDEGRSELSYLDLIPISNFVDEPPVESIVPVEEPPVPLPDLYYIDTDLEGELALERNSVAIGANTTGFVLHPAHPDWVVFSQGSCSEATSTWLIDGEIVEEEFAGSAVGFFRGRGLPVLATTTTGPGCGAGQLWVVDLQPLSVSVSLVADGVDSADIRDEAPDPWNPNAAPPFA